MLWINLWPYLPPPPPDEPFHNFRASKSVARRSWTAQNNSQSRGSKIEKVFVGLYHYNPELTNVMYSCRIEQLSTVITILYYDANKCNICMPENRTNPTRHLATLRPLNSRIDVFQFYKNRRMLQSLRKMARNV